MQLGESHQRCDGDYDCDYLGDSGQTTVGPPQASDGVDVLQMDSIVSALKQVKMLNYEKPSRRF